MLNENNKILKYKHGEKSMRVPFVIYTDLECFLEKKHSCQNNTEKSYTQKKIKQTPFGYSLFTNCSTCSTIVYNLIVTKANIVWKGYVRSCNENN